MHLRSDLRNEERVNQVLVRDFCVSALPAPGCGVVVTTMQRCSVARRVWRRHFGYKLARNYGSSAAYVRIVGCIM